MLNLWYSVECRFVTFSFGLSSTRNPPIPSFWILTFYGKSYYMLLFDYACERKPFFTKYTTWKHLPFNKQSQRQCNYNSDFLNNEKWPECIPCNSKYSLKHVLIDCVDVADVRQTFYNVNNLSNLFTNVAGDTILKFSKEFNL